MPGVCLHNKVYVISHRERHVLFFPHIFFFAPHFSPHPLPNSSHHELIPPQSISNFNALKNWEVYYLVLQTGQILNFPYYEGLFILLYTIKNKPCIYQGFIYLYDLPLRRNCSVLGHFLNLLCILHNLP